jgi:predicted nucleic acid-binding protein
MTDAPRRVYWDACAWIGLLNNEPDKHPPLRIIWEHAQRGQFEIWTSTYSYLEVLEGRPALGAAYPPEENDAKIYALFEQPYVKRVALDVEIGKLARSLKRKYHPILSKRSDAIHLATALYWNLEELHPWDGSDLLPLNEKINRRDGVPLKIIAPGPEVHGALFAGNAPEVVITAADSLGDAKAEAEKK